MYVFPSSDTGCSLQGIHVLTYWCHFFINYSLLLCISLKLSMTFWDACIELASFMQFGRWLNLMALIAKAGVKTLVHSLVQNIMHLDSHQSRCRQREMRWLMEWCQLPHHPNTSNCGMQMTYWYPLLLHSVTNHCTCKRSDFHSHQSFAIVWILLWRGIMVIAYNGIKIHANTVKSHFISTETYTLTGSQQY